MKKSQKGFALVEGLLTVIAIALIVFVGYYVWHSQKQTNKTLDTATNTSNSTPAPSKKTVVQDINKGYFVFKEWGVRAKYTGNLSLEYKRIDTQGHGQSFAFTSKELLAADPACSAENLVGGVIPRYGATETVEDPDSPSGVAPAKEFYSANPQLATHIGNYYFMFRHAQAACSDKQSAMDLQTQTNDAVKSLVQNLESLPEQ